MFENIPIYRLALYPESFLPRADMDIDFIAMASELPNHKGICHKNIMRGLLVQDQKKYYLNQLLIESKVFLREKYKILKMDSSVFDDFKLPMTREDCFAVIRSHQLIFFRSLILEDLKKFSLFEAKVKEEIEDSQSVEEVWKHLKKRQIHRRLSMQLERELKALQRAYCD